MRTNGQGYQTSRYDTNYLALNDHLNKVRLLKSKDNSDLLSIIKSGRALKNAQTGVDQKENYHNNKEDNQELEGGGRSGEGSIALDKIDIQGQAVHRIDRRQWLMQ